MSISTTQCCHRPPILYDICFRNLFFFFLCSALSLSRALSLSMGAYDFPFSFGCGRRITWNMSTLSNPFSASPNPIQPWNKTIQNRTTTSTEEGDECDGEWRVAAVTGVGGRHWQNFHCENSFFSPFPACCLSLFFVKRKIIASRWKLTGWVHRHRHQYGHVCNESFTLIPIDRLQWRR